MQPPSSPVAFQRNLQRGLPKLAYLVLLACPVEPDPTEVFVHSLVGLAGTALVRRPEDPAASDEAEEPAPNTTGRERMPEAGDAGWSAAPGPEKSVDYTVWESF